LEHDVRYWLPTQPVDATLEFLKGTELSMYPQTHLNKVARQLDERPRKTLQFETPAERLNSSVASTG
jgi:transposase, IS30 family